MDKSGNPALGKSVLDKINAVEHTDSATLSGTVSKVLILFAIMAFGAFNGWRLVVGENLNAGVILFGSLIIATMLAFVTIFVPKISPYTSPVYALLEGVVLGSISGLYNQSINGIAMQALLLTGCVFISVLYLYVTRMVRVTNKMRSIIIISTAAIALFYLLALVGGFFGIKMPLIYDSGIYGIIFSLIVIFVAALNLLLDFDFIERATNSKLPKFFEWYGAFSLMITLVWLYLEILRLLGKARS